MTDRKNIFLIGQLGLSLGFDWLKMMLPTNGPSCSMTKKANLQIDTRLCQPFNSEKPGNPAHVQFLILKRRKQK